jgi:hypothetical protein
VFATAAIVLVAQHFWQGGSTESLLEQRGAVSPKTTFSGIVYYPSPYGAPPNLKVTSAKRQYDIVKQDETGFTWKALVIPEDIREDQRVHAEAMISVGMRHVESMRNKLNGDIQFEEFTWDAKGTRPGKDSVLVQEGIFNTIAGTKGEVNFPIPYTVAPNVELSGQASGAVIIVESRPTSFKWQNTPQTAPFAVNSGSVTWKAKGVRTPETAPPKGH